MRFSIQQLTRFSLLAIGFAPTLALAAGGGKVIGGCDDAMNIKSVRSVAEVVQNIHDKAIAAVKIWKSRGDWCQFQKSNAMILRNSCQGLERDKNGWVKKSQEELNKAKAAAPRIGAAMKKLKYESCEKDFSGFAQKIRPTEQIFEQNFGVAYQACCSAKPAGGTATTAPRPTAAPTPPATRPASQPDPDWSALPLSP